MNDPALLGMSFYTEFAVYEVKYKSIPAAVTWAHTLPHGEYLKTDVQITAGDILCNMYVN